MPVRVEGSHPAVPAVATGPLPPPPVAGRPMFEFRPDLKQRSETHRINLANRRLDHADYERYLDRWVAGLRSCRTREELAAYGDPQAPPSSTPGDLTSREAEDFFDLQWHALSHWKRAVGAQADVELRLRGLPVPLSAELSASAQVSLGLGNRQLAAGASVGPAGVTADAALGSRTQKLTVSGGPHAPLTAGRQVGVPGAVATTSGGDRLDRLELEAFPTAAASPFVATDGRSVEVGARAGRTVKKGAVVVGAEARASVKVNLLSRNVALWALTNRRAPGAG
jgi:hypothetical protein